MEKLNLKFILFLLLLNVNCLYSQSDYELGLVEFDKKNYQKSFEFFNKSIQNKQELAKSYMYRGALNIYFGNRNDSKMDLDASYKLDSINEKIYFYYGKYYFVMGDYKESINNYNIAILKNPKFANAYADRAVPKFTIGDVENAFLDIDEAIKLDSKNQKAFSNRGFFKIKLKKFDDAIMDIDISLKILPNQKDFANKGLASLNLNMFYAGINNFTKSLEFTPNDPEILYFRGYCYEQLGILDKACEDYNKSNSISISESTEKGLFRISCKK